MIGINDALSNLQPINWAVIKRKIIKNILASYSFFEIWNFAAIKIDLLHEYHLWDYPHMES